jgi:hypothetical protein
MKTFASFSLTLVTFASAWGQTYFSGSMSHDTDVEIFFESKIEPAEPHLSMAGVSNGVRPFTNQTWGLRRFSANAATHEYFGYDLRVDPVDVHSGVYRVTFSALSLTPEDMGLSGAGWRSLPPPAFPAPQIVNAGDTIALPLFESPATGQKVVDYLMIKRHNCNSENGPNQIACLNGLIEDEQKSQSDKVARESAKRGAMTAAVIQETQPLFEKYRDTACAGLATEVKRLQCKLDLTRERTHDIGNVY